MTAHFAPPPTGCPLCPRLAAFRAKNRECYPGWHHDPVPSFGGLEARLLIVGLAPGLKGANRTGRPFTGDYAGDLLYTTLLQFGWAKGDYQADPSDTLTLQDCRITNAVRCVPPDNKPEPGEIRTCNAFLQSEIASMHNLQLILVLGRVAHEATLRALRVPLKNAPFAHGARHRMNNLAVFSSYHCSRYNTSTGRLTPAMFHAVMAALTREATGDRVSSSQ